MNEEFACAILIELVRAFQIQKNSQSMDCFSLAIQVCNSVHTFYIHIFIYDKFKKKILFKYDQYFQEILRAYNISPQGRNNELWNNLPFTTQQIITPFLTSHYKIATVSDDHELPHPIYGYIL